MTGRIGPLATGSALSTQPALGVDVFTLADVIVERVQAWLHANSDFPIDVRLIVAEVDASPDSEVLEILATSAPDRVYRRGWS